MYFTFAKQSNLHVQYPRAPLEALISYIVILFKYRNQYDTNAYIIERNSRILILLLNGYFAFIPFDDKAIDTYI